MDWLYAAHPAHRYGFDRAAPGLPHLTADLVVGTAQPERAGAASALSETGAELGGALGIAVLGSLGTAVYRSGVAAALPPGVTSETARAAQETLAGQLPDPLRTALLNATQGAFILSSPFVQIVLKW